MFILPPFDVHEPTLAEFKAILEVENIPIQSVHEDTGLILFSYGPHSVYFSDCFSCLHEYYAEILVYNHDDVHLNPRNRFDDVFDESLQKIDTIHGPPTVESRFQRPDMDSAHFYRYAIWKLENSRLALMQNEADIRSGHDINLRYLYHAGNAERMLYGKNSG